MTKKDKAVGFTGIIKKNVGPVVQVDSAPNTEPVKVSAFLDAELYIRLREFCTRNRVTAKALILDAIKQYLGSKTF